MNDLPDGKKVISTKYVKVVHDCEFPVTLRCETVVWTLCMTYWEDVNDFLMEIPYIYTLTTLGEALEKLKNLQQKEVKLEGDWLVEFSFEKIEDRYTVFNKKFLVKYHMFMQKKSMCDSWGTKSWLEKKNRIGECFIVKNSVNF